MCRHSVKPNVTPLKIRSDKIFVITFAPRPANLSKRRNIWHKLIVSRKKRIGRLRSSDISTSNAIRLNLIRKGTLCKHKNVRIMLRPSTSKSL